MKDELKITKEDLVLWLDRPPSDEDFELCSYLANALEKQQYYLIMNELKKWLEEAKTVPMAGSPIKYYYGQVLLKIKELEEGVK